jgi:predicted metal-binding membrane protein
MREARSAVSQRPKLAVAVALMLMIALAWLLLAGGTHALLAAPDHVHAPGVVARHWGAAHWFAAWFMWATMTVAMMLPTAAPVVLSFAGAGAGATLRQTGAFVAGYLAVWWGFGVLATALQWLLASPVRNSPTAPGVATALAGCLLVLVGLYQFSSLKRRCLAHCHGPLGFFHSHWRASSLAAHQFGLRHGFHCLGCCWALMLLMLLAGAMNFGWTAALAGLMLAEKVLPGGHYLGRAAGIGLIGWGSVLIAAV